MERESTALVVDVPFRALEHADPAQGRCTHVRADGLQCGRPAEMPTRECRWHWEWYERFPSITQMPYPEDAISIQHVLARTAAMALNREITPAHASAVAALCREMRQNLARFEWEMRRAIGRELSTTGPSTRARDVPPRPRSG